MKYEDAVRAAQPSLPIKTKFFEKYFRPYIKTELDEASYKYFLEQSFSAWRKGVQKQDIQNMLFVESLCSELAAKFPSEFLQIVIKMLEEVDNTHLRLTESEKNFYEADESRPTTRAKALLDHYKVFFETALRLWATVPYLYCTKRLGFKTSANCAEEFVRVSGGEKFQMLKNRTVPITYGKLSDLVEGFNNEMRNSGSGHEWYEVEDDGSITLNDVEPKSGKLKGRKHYAYGEIQQQLDLCRKTVWVLKNGLQLFLTNNPGFSSKLQLGKRLRLREVQDSFEDFADTRWLEVEGFSLNKGVLKLVLSKKKKMGVGGEILFGNGERYDIISTRHVTTYKKQVLGVLRYLSNLLTLCDQKISKIDVTVKDEKDNLVYDISVDAKELQSSIQTKSDPKLLSGNLADAEFEMITESPVPYGMRSFFETELTLQGFDIIKSK